MHLSGDLTDSSLMHSQSLERHVSTGRWPVMVCILGSFRLLKNGYPVATPSGGRAEALLSAIGVQHPEGIERERLLDLLWPASSPAAAGHSMNSLVSILHRQLRDALGGAPPVILAEGRYRLNGEAGVGLDLACFSGLIEQSEREERAGDLHAAIDSARAAVQLYRGELPISGDIGSLIQRERLRNLYLGALARLADHSYLNADFGACLDYTTRLLENDPCREDAHRLAMRSHLQRGERSHALRQYHLCSDILRQEFDAIPEAETTALYDEIRMNPGDVIREM
jgi:DNA-binding SARP family transcriptional activator